MLELNCSDIEIERYNDIERYINLLHLVFLSYQSENHH